MSDPIVKSIVSGKLEPGEFWGLDAFKDHGFLQTIHANIVERLQNDSPDADMLELMLMERCAFLYIFMRAKETDLSEFTFDRVYSDMLGKWVNMAADLRKQRLRAEESASIRAAVVGEIARALKDALHDVDPKVANEVQSRLIHLVSA